MRTSATVQEWRSVVARVRGLREAASEYLPHPRAGEYSSGGYLMEQARRIVEDTTELRKRGDQAIGPAALACVDRALRLDWYNFIGNPAVCLAVTTQLAAFASELEYHLRDHEAAWASQVEHAFLHLNRLLFVDQVAHDKWRAAFDEGEPECEKLGALHLLSHGIWAFKAHGLRERTDLILGTRIAEPSERERRAVDVLTHTEWKKIGPGDTAAKKFAEAKDQTREYAAGVFAGFELASVRYVVTVGIDHERDLDDVPVGPVRYRHVHVTIKRPPPSVVARS